MYSLRDSRFISVLIRPTWMRRPGGTRRGLDSRNLGISERKVVHGRRLRERSRQRDRCPGRNAAGWSSTGRTIIQRHTNAVVEPGRIGHHDAGCTRPSVLWVTVKRYS